MGNANIDMMYNMISILENDIDKHDIILHQVYGENNFSNFDFDF